MAEKAPSGGGDSSILMDMFLFLAFLFFVWFMTGGPERGSGLVSESDGTEYNKDYNSLSGSETEDEPSRTLEEEMERLQEFVGTSVYKDKVILKSGGAEETDVNEEYLIIEVSKNAKSKINVSDWKVQSVMSGRSMEIGEASYLPYSSTVNVQEPIYLSAGDKLILTTGRSPIGTSFRTNICTGYFEQFQDFYPTLKEVCPRPEDEEDFVTFGPNAYDDNCIEFVEDMPRCELYSGEYPEGMKYECYAYVSEITYNTCVANHKNKDGFYSNEWRVFLNREDELWKENREGLKLLDAEGRLVDTVTY